MLTAYSAAVSPPRARTAVTTPPTGPQYSYDDGTAYYSPAQPQIQSSGYYSGYTAAGPPPTMRRMVESRWAGAIAGLMLTLGIVIGLLVPIVRDAVSDSPVAQSSSSSTTAEETLGGAVESCGADNSRHIRLIDDSSGVTMSGQGEESAGADMFTMFCIFDALEMPERTINKVEMTRALDGQISDTWGEFKGTWSYHPDSGLNMTIEVIND